MVNSERRGDGRGPPRDLVVVGASAGGVEALRRVIGDLPPDLPASVCVVLHIAPGSPSALAPILQRSTQLMCHAAEDGEILRPGVVLVASPDRHLVVVDGQVALSVGPRENGHRPAVDALFRTAAEALSERVVGVVLSGTRDDGSAGLAAIKAAGGAAIVQDPEEALYAGMPASALMHVDVDIVAPSERIAEAIVAMVKGEPPPPGLRESHHAPDDDHDGPVTTVCPECGGVLSERLEAGMAQWQCKVGHRYSPDSLADAQAEGVEAALWAAIRALEDRHVLLDRMASQADLRRQPRSAASFRRRAHAASEHAKAVRDALHRAAATTLRSVEPAAIRKAGSEESAA